MSSAKRTVVTSTTVDSTNTAIILQPLDLVPIQAALQTFAQLEAGGRPGALLRRSPG